MTGDARVEGRVVIDETRIQVISREQRLRAAAIEYLKAAQDVATREGLEEDAKKLGEVVAWLGEMELNHAR